MEKEEVGRQDYKNFDIKEWLSRKIFYIFMLFVVINRNDKNNPPRITHFCPARISPTRIYVTNTYQSKSPKRAMCLCCYDGDDRDAH